MQLTPQDRIILHKQRQSYLASVIKVKAHYGVHNSLPLDATWIHSLRVELYEGLNFNSGNYLFTADTKQIHVSEVLLSFSVVTSIVYNPLPPMWKS